MGADLFGGASKQHTSGVPGVSPIHSGDWSVPAAKCVGHIGTVIAGGWSKIIFESESSIN